jgi:hypothetical protein
MLINEGMVSNLLNEYKSQFSKEVPVKGIAPILSEEGLIPF